MEWMTWMDWKRFGQMNFNMEKYDLTDILEMGSDFNLKLNPKIERRCVDGNWGMYATDTIKSGEILVSSNKPNIVEYSDYIDMLLKYAAEYELGAESKLYPFFNSNGDSYKRDSVYYATEEELHTIKLISPIVSHQIDNFIGIVSKNINKLQTEHNVSKETAEYITLMAEARKWSSGFMPVFDLFNHNMTLGNPMYIVKSDGGDLYMFLSKKEYSAGEEIFVSYSIKDTLTYAINYNFYDDSDIHMINIPNRLLFKINTELDTEICNGLKESYSITEFSIGDSQVYKINNQLPLVNSAPSYNLIELARSISYTNKDDIINNNVSDELVDSNLIEWLSNSFHKANLEEIGEGGIGLDKLTPLVKRFIYIVNKENELIQSAINWVVTSSNVYPNRFLTQSFLGN